MDSRFRREHVRDSRLGIFHVDAVLAASITHFGTPSDIEEGTPEEYFEGCILDDLNLKVDGDRPELDRVILQPSESH